MSKTWVVKLVGEGWEIEKDFPDLEKAIEFFIKNLRDKKITNSSVESKDS